MTEGLVPLQQRLPKKQTPPRDDQVIISLFRRVSVELTDNDRANAAGSPLHTKLVGGTHESISVP